MRDLGIVSMDLREEGPFPSQVEFGLDIASCNHEKTVLRINAYCGHAS